MDEILWYDLDFFIEDSDGSERGEYVRDPPFKETGCGVEKDLEKRGSTAYKQTHKQTLFA